MCNLYAHVLRASVAPSVLDVLKSRKVTLSVNSWDPSADRPFLTSGIQSGRRIAMSVVRAVMEADDSDGPRLVIETWLQ
jgi:hypothetical protein